ncbi:MAG: hypothetical protein NE327_12485 [Lentisphaeraceae bacterium]|nr:hypothetical protein [Lentisphaeraceae bacterium]
MRCFLILCILLFSVHAEDKAVYRTDTSNEKAPWYKLKKGEFPPEDAAHYLAGELIDVDHVNGVAQIRLDRTDAQRTDDYDAPMEFTLMPYATVKYNGSYAALKDIPLGTHLHGKFFRTGKPNTVGWVHGGAIDFYKHGDASFDQCVLLEDDFTYYQKQKKSWKVLKLDLSKKTVDVQLNGEENSKPKTFRITDAVRVWKGKSIAELKDLEGQNEILFNFTEATLTGPGRILEVWLDKESREIAAKHQKAKHIVYRHKRGLAAQITAVDNQKKTVTVAILAGYDEELLSPFYSKGHVSAAVANENLRTHHQHIDGAHGNIIDFKKLPSTTYDTGIRFTFTPNVFLEGFRPKEMLMVFKWGIYELPREERLYK